MQHSNVGPSSLEAIILCPGRVKISQGLDDHTSFQAAQGTIAHALCEQFIEHGESQGKYKKDMVINQDGYEILIDQEMISASIMYNTCINVIRKRGQLDGENPFQEYAESKISLKNLGRSEIYGTLDYAAVLPSTKTLYIIDYKYGAGIDVDAYKNPQLIAYALGMLEHIKDSYGYDLKIEKVILGVVQPRIFIGKKVKSWETTPEELLSFFYKHIDPAVTSALYSDKNEFNPGEKQCRWCKAVAICPAIAKQTLMAAQSDFKQISDFKPSKIDTLSTQDIVSIHSKLPLFKKWIKCIEEKIFSELAAGTKIDGLKLVNGRNKKKWTDVQEAEKFLFSGLDDKAWDVKLLSPAKAKKLLEPEFKKVLDNYITILPGKPTVVSDTDKRPSIMTAHEDFKQLT